MALKNKRSITISLSDSIYDQIDKISASKNRSKSSIIEELLSEQLTLEAQRAKDIELVGEDIAAFKEQLAKEIERGHRILRNVNLIDTTKIVVEPDSKK